MFSPLATKRKRAASRRSVLGLLGVLWLNMAVLPCAMAWQGDDDCPHSPPAQEHEDHRAMSAHHGHGQVEAEPPCATAQAQCCEAIAASVDTRGGKADGKPASDSVFVIAPLPDHSGKPLQAMWQADLGPPDAFGSAPRLHVLFCVYLD